jgi:hypothetical protein
VIIFGLSSVLTCTPTVKLGDKKATQNISYAADLGPFGERKKPRALEDVTYAAALAIAGTFVYTHQQSDIYVSEVNSTPSSL